MLGCKRKAAPLQSAQQRMWTAMRIHRAFTVADIAAAAKVPTETAKTFVRRLRKATFVILRNKNAHHGPGVPGAYVLVRDTGSEAPRILGDGRAFDVNLQLYIPEKVDELR